jgi:hypothetical protein
MKFNRGLLTILILLVLALLGAGYIWHARGSSQCETTQPREGVHTLESCLKPGTTLNGT